MFHEIAHPCSAEALSTTKSFRQGDLEVGISRAGDDAANYNMRTKSIERDQEFEIYPIKKISLLTLMRRCQISLTYSTP